MYSNVFNSNENLKILGVGEAGDTNIDNMVEGRILPWVIDNNTYNVWNHWEIENRDLIFLDKDGNFSQKINLTDNLYDQLLNDITSIINELLNDD